MDHQPQETRLLKVRAGPGVRHGMWLNYGVRDGLPSSCIVDAVQDLSGRIWFASSQTGVSCFDGHTFTNLTPTGVPPGTGVLSLALDLDGDLWLASYGGGLVRYDGREFTCFTVEDGLSGWKITAVLTDTRGRIWCAVGDLYDPSYRGGVHYFDGRCLVSCQGAGELVGANVLSLAEDSDGVIWAGTHGRGAWQLANAGARRVTPERGGMEDEVWSMALDSTGRMWLGTGSGVARAVDGRLESVPGTGAMEGVAVLAMHEDDQGRMWLGYERWRHQPAVRRSTNHVHHRRRAGGQPGVVGDTRSRGPSLDGDPGWRRQSVRRPVHSALQHGGWPSRCRRALRGREPHRRAVDWDATGGGAPGERPLPASAAAVRRQREHGTARPEWKDLVRPGRGSRTGVPRRGHLAALHDGRRPAW